MPVTQRVLIVYYSLSGNTERVARDLARQLDADLERVHEHVNRRGLLGYAGAIFDSLRERAAVLGDVTRDAAQYDLTIVGTPIWAGRITPAVRTYLKSIRGRARCIAFFTTSGNTPAQTVLPSMEKLADRPAIACLGLTDRELRTADVYEKKLTAFLRELREAPGSSPVVAGARSTVDAHA